MICISSSRRCRWFAISVLLVIFTLLLLSPLAASKALAAPQVKAKASSQVATGSSRSLLSTETLNSLPHFDAVEFSFAGTNRVLLPEVPRFSSKLHGRFAGMNKRNEIVLYTVEPNLQSYVSAIVKKANAPHVAAVVMEPRTGRILAIADKSTTSKDLSLHAGFPAASLFKIVTAAAALEKGAIVPGSIINFRGGTYTLARWNYKPDEKKDNRFMTVKEALGKSCNAVFARIALKYLSPSILREYAAMFGFNSPLAFNMPLPVSEASIPADDFLLSRTAAGFGEVKVGPVHAAAIMSAISNHGLLPQPSLVDRVISSDGQIMYSAAPKAAQRVIRASTADALLRMMEATTTVGTSRREFMVNNRSRLNIPVSAKTGTLTGHSPKGLNNWFIASAPIDDPEIAVAVIVVNAQNRQSKASHLGRLILERHFEQTKAS